MLQKTETPQEAATEAAVDDIFEAVSRTFDRAFERKGANKKAVITTFEAALESLKKAKDPEMRLRTIAKSAALSTGRCHGNVMETGRCLLESLAALSAKHGFKPEFARDQVLLGLAEGTCQIGPVVYCRFLDVANSYKEGADEWIAKNRRLSSPPEVIVKPVIVPYEAELTIKPVSEVKTLKREDIEEVPHPAPPARPEAEWSSKPGQRNIFRRLSDAVGHFFGH